jgi:hypothetical protein
MLYMYGGFGYDNSGQTQLHCLDLNTLLWSTVHQKGSIPDRTFVDNKQKSFQTTVAADGVMLAFGRAVQVGGSFLTAAAHARWFERPLG